MSWSITLIGKPENVAKALEDYSTKMDGASKTEFDAALPHLVALVKENFGNTSPIVQIIASGSGYSSNGEHINRSCTVRIENIYGTLV